MSELERAWAWREQKEFFSRSGCARVFHGPVEGTRELSGALIDRFGDWCWVTEREGAYSIDAAVPKIIEFLRSRGMRGAVVVRRPKKGISSVSELLFGERPLAELQVAEGSLKFWVRLLGVRHPGLFLDHEPLRNWLSRSCDGLRVLNTFAYTGSLSIAAAAGGAEHVTTLDLSRPSLQWAQKNWKLNGFPDDRAQWIVGDVFEWWPRLTKGTLFDCVILDPPSFSRGKKKSFSTANAQDLVRLHQGALRALVDGGILATSINSYNVSEEKLRRAVDEAAKLCGKALDVVQTIEQPETFPWSLEDESTRYLKGWVLRARNRPAAVR